MTRASPLHRLFTLLAMLATMLLLGLPTVGRLLGEQGHASMAMQAICTPAGLQHGVLQWPVASVPASGPSGLLSASPAHATRDTSGVDTKPPHAGDGMGGHGGRHDGMDCDYCPLLLTLLAFAVVLWLALSATPFSPASVVRARPAWPEPYPCGLGSRGPPCLMA